MRLPDRRRIRCPLCGYQSCRGSLKAHMGSARCAKQRSRAKRAGVELPRFRRERELCDAIAILDILVTSWEDEELSRMAEKGVTIAGVCRTLPKHQKCTSTSSSTSKP